MPYLKSQMLYDDGNYYKWKAGDDKDNPYYKGGTDRAELNRTEGYEVLYFINHFGENYFKEAVALKTYQKIEKMIRYDVPSNIRKREKIKDWIIANW
jgi:hypothetical protein